MPPYPKSNAAKKAAGGHPYRMKPGEISLPPGMPECPIELNSYAQAAWDKLVPVLYEAGLLTVIDGPAVALAARALGDLEEAKGMIAKTGGAVVKGGHGGPIVNPWCTVHQRAFDNVRRLLTEFGLTPATRGRVQATKPPTKGETDPLEGILG